MNLHANTYTEEHLYTFLHTLKRCVKDVSVLPVSQHIQYARAQWHQPHFGVWWGGGGLFKFVITDLIDQMSSKPQGSTWIHLPKYRITAAHHHNHLLIFILCPICFASWEIEYRSLAMLRRQCVTEVYLQLSVTSTKTLQISNPVWRQQVTQGSIRTQMYSGTLKYCM